MHKESTEKNIRSIESFINLIMTLWNVKDIFRIYIRRGLSDKFGQNATKAVTIINSNGMCQ